MTASKHWTIWCDYPECPAWTDHGSSTAENTRRLAKKEGWTVGLYGGRDLCPRHDRLTPVPVGGDS